MSSTIALPPRRVMRTLLACTAVLLAISSAACGDEPPSPNIATSATAAAAPAATAVATPTLPGSNQKPGSAGAKEIPGPDTPIGRAPALGIRPQIVSYDGIRGLRFGDSERELIARGVVVRDIPGCGPRLATPNGVNPVFVDGRLALVWADPPLHTPEGVAVGDKVTEVHKAYPTAHRLRAPVGSYRFGGLLARKGDRAYLFLHDGQMIHKLIVGYAQHAQTLFNRGFASC